MWVGFKAISETVESCASVELPPRRLFNAPAFEPPPGGLHYRWPDLPGPQIEHRLEAKKNAVLAFAAANPIDRRIYDIPDATYGIVTTGKGHLDLMEALAAAGARRDRMPAARHRHLQGRHGVAAGASRRAGIRAREARDPGDRGKARHHREPVQGIFLRLSRPQAGAHGRQERREQRAAGALGRRIVAAAAGADRRQAAGPDFSRSRPHRRAPKDCCGRAPRSSTYRARPARPISARAVRTTPRPKCPRDRRRWPASAAISWRAGWTATPRR